MINVEINGKLVGQCESAGKASSPLFKDVIEPWIEIRGFIASSLTDDQQEVLEWLQIHADKDSGDKPFQTIWYFLDLAGNNGLGLTDLIAFLSLNREQQFQFLAAFAEWAQEQEDE